MGQRQGDGSKQRSTEVQTCDNQAKSKTRAMASILSMAGY